MKKFNVICNSVLNIVLSILFGFCLISCTFGVFNPDIVNVFVYDMYGYEGYYNVAAIGMGVLTIIGGLCLMTLVCDIIRKCSTEEIEED